MALMIRHPTCGFALLGSLIAAAFTFTPTMADDSSTVAANALQLEPIPAYRQFQDCTADLPDSLPCRILDAPVRSEVERRLGERAATAWGSGDRWTIAFRAPDDSVTAVDVMGGIQLPLSRFEGTSLWVLALRLPGADSAVISIDFFVHRGKKFQRDTTTLREWRGQHAPPKPSDAVQLAGSLKDELHLE